MALYSKTGTYTGNGASTKSITGIGFRPKVVFVWSAETGSGETGIYWVNDINLPAIGYIGDNGYDINSSGAYDRFYSLDSDGFTVLYGTTYHALNKNGATYYYFCLGGSDVATGSYVGNGSDNRTITGVGFQPEFVLTEGSTYHTNHKTLASGASTDVSQRTYNDVDISNGIQSLDSDGFTIGTDVTVNNSGTTYHWFAIKQGSSVKTGLYTGNGVDNRNITGVGFQPIFLLIKSSSAYYAVIRNDQMPTDSAKYRSSLGFVTNIIQGLNTDGFQVGSDSTSNASGSTYYYLAIKGSAPSLNNPAFLLNFV